MLTLLLASRFFFPVICFIAKGRVCFSLYWPQAPAALFRSSVHQKTRSQRVLIKIFQGNYDFWNCYTCFILVVWHFIIFWPYKGKYMGKLTSLSSVRRTYLNRRGKHCTVVNRTPTIGFFLYRFNIISTKRINHLFNN